MQRKLKPNNIIYVFFAILFSFIFLYPVYFTVISSLKDNNEIWNTMFALPKEINLDNYRSAINDIGILRSVLNSFIFSFGATIIVVITVTMGSYVISRKLLKACGFLRLYYLLGLMIPAYGMLIPIVKMFTTFGLQDHYLPMIILYAGINFPMSFYLIVGHINGLSREIDEAAYIDGCSTTGIVFRVIFPIARPGIFTGAIITFLAVYNELIFANTLLQQKSMQTISVTLLGLKGERFTSWGPMFASIVLSIVPIMVIYLIFQERIEGGIAAGAVKG
ncbi:carbohydrate ABC transporter permease [Ruminiclostridium cellobioparum]|uniref:ABC-type sugar transport system, permease component n=1 Tax=Ruminiclostridium cellobioparum subsp. termitidis CT1112 TaxID=1195236 RepID=S0FKF7_RUMCE|nr:carbohydrate ABC transporter permease [Ruminiclostridium cellobioparum]EMS72700.1 ABC-type sugar transport system, permease component [Ruminiclostridium cellobioparum subsp. termitidis CT1112]